MPSELIACSADLSPNSGKVSGNLLKDPSEIFYHLIPFRKSCGLSGVFSTLINTKRLLAAALLSLGVLVAIIGSASASLPDVLSPLAPIRLAQSETKDKLEAIVVPPDELFGEVELRPFDEVIQDLERHDGLFTVYRDAEQSQVYMALQPNQLNQNFLLIATLESGIGEAGLYRGWPINDVLIQFRAAPDNKLHLVVPNIYFRSAPNAQGRQLVQQSFSDSTLYALNIVSRHPETNEVLVDLKDLLLSRDPANLANQFAWVLGSYSPNPEISYLSQIKSFPDNLEIETTMGYSGGGGDPLAFLFTLSPESLPDPRGFSLTVRYSLSRLSDNPRYTPRLADERVGYFLTAFRPPATDSAREPFIRYIHRWHLEKRDPSAAISEPVKPIVFWLENTIPEAHREAIRIGVLWWNEAFERAGFRNAIQVRQMPNDADWDPADVRYNVIRWSDSFRTWAVGLGPSRVNPLTGEILDADVILDANVIRLLRRQYDAFATSSADIQTYLQLCGHRFQPLYEAWLADTGVSRRQMQTQSTSIFSSPDHRGDHCAGFMGAQQLAFGAMALAELDGARAIANLDTYINQYLQALTAHEVGHVLGLRHNFVGSTLLSPEELNQPEISRARGLVSSVMDYFPPNLAPPAQPQGDYFPTRLGPYDLWAIEYGYKTLPGHLPQLHRQALNRIADRAQSPELTYAADEDIFDFLDPLADAWDLSSDPLQYAQGQMDLARTLWDRLNWYSLSPGEGYGQLRARVDLMFNYYLGKALTINNYLGGARFRRIDPWGSQGQNPLELVSAEQQRQALELLDKYVFAPDAFQFSPELINSLSPERWRHWGQRPALYPLDYPIYDRISFIQSLVLSDLMFSERLVRLRDAEIKAGSQEVFKLEELFDRVGKMVWAELNNESSSPVSIDGLRRGLQRQHLTILSNLVLRDIDGLYKAQSFEEFIGAAAAIGSPEDARVLARYQLGQIETAISQTLKRQGQQLDLTTRAHLEDARDRIVKVLDARFQTR